MNFSDNYFEMMALRMQSAFRAMTDLERGAIANPDENRMVGHYWLRTPALAPSLEIRREIERTVVDIKSFASRIGLNQFPGICRTDYGVSWERIDLNGRVVNGRVVNHTA